MESKTVKLEIEVVPVPESDGSETELPEGVSSDGLEEFMEVDYTISFIEVEEGSSSSQRELWADYMEVDSPEVVQPQVEPEAGESIPMLESFEAAWRQKQRGECIPTADENLSLWDDVLLNARLQDDPWTDPTRLDRGNDRAQRLQHYPSTDFTPLDQGDVRARRLHHDSWTDLGCNARLQDDPWTDPTRLDRGNDRAQRLQHYPSTDFTPLDQGDVRARRLHHDSWTDLGCNARLQDDPWTDPTRLDRGNDRAQRLQHYPSTDFTPLDQGDVRARRLHHDSWTDLGCNARLQDDPWTDPTRLDRGNDRAQRLQHYPSTDFTPLDQGDVRARWLHHDSWTDPTRLDRGNDRAQRLQHYPWMDSTPLYQGEDRAQRLLQDPGAGFTPLDQGDGRARRLHHDSWTDPARLDRGDDRAQRLQHYPWIDPTPLDQGEDRAQRLQQDPGAGFTPLDQGDGRARRLQHVSWTDPTRLDRGKSLPTIGAGCLQPHLDSDTTTPKATPIMLPFETDDTDYKKLYYEKLAREKELLEKQTKLKRSLRTERKKASRRLDSSKSWKQKAGDLKKQVKRLQRKESADTKIARKVRENPILLDSIKNASRNPRARRFCKQTKKFATDLYLSSPAAYRTVKEANVLCLPTKRSIQHYNSDVKLSPGISESLLNRLEQKAQSFTKKEKAVMITIDGMAVKPSLNYHAKSDVFTGFPSDGIDRKIEKNKTTRLATEAVVALVQGVAPLEGYRWEEVQGKGAPGKSKKPKRYKQAVGYILGHHTVGSEVQKKFVTDLTRALRLRGFYPVGLVLDQCTTNIKMVKESGATKDRPVMCLGDTDVAIFYDNPHLIKNTKSMLMRYNAVFNGQIASFSHVVKLYELDCNAIPRLVPRLTEKCIYPAPFRAMNVAQAVRTVSGSTADGMEYHVDEGNLPLSALHTAQTLRFFDKLFDTFNSKDAVNSVKPLRSPITAESTHWEFLMEAKELLGDMYYTSNSAFTTEQAKADASSLTRAQRKPNSLMGFTNNINALHWLWDKLTDEFSFESLCTNYLTQDIAENHFSETRWRGGRDDCPTVDKFAAATKYAAIAANQRIPGANCEPDGAECLLDDEICAEEFEQRKNKRFEYKKVPLDLDAQKRYTPHELNGLVYIVGAAARKLDPDCKGRLVARKDAKELNEKIYSFSKLKNCKTLPNSKLFEIGLLAYTVFVQRFKKMLYQNRYNVKARMKEYLAHKDYEKHVCLKCFNSLIDKIFNTLIKAFVKRVNSKLRGAASTRLAPKIPKRNRKAVRMCLPI